jgi:uncharacterized protein involved in exopolysaccharide biosynthesis
MDLKQYIQIVLNNKRIIITITILSTLFAFAGYYIIPPNKYSASTTIYVKPEAAKILLEKGKTQNLTQVSTTGAQYIPQTYKLLFESRFLQERVVKILNLDRPKESTGFRKKIKGVLKPIKTWVEKVISYVLYGVYNPDPFEKAVKRLKKKVKVKQQLKTYLFTITAKDKDPQVAADIANTIANEFVKYSSSINSSEAKGYREFLEQRIKILDGELKQAQKNLEDFKDKYGIADLNEETKLDLKTLSSFQETLDKVNAEIREMKILQREITMGKYVRKEDNLMRFSTEKENSILDKLGKDLAKSEIELSSLVEKYTDSNKKVIDLRAEIETTKEKINKQVREIMDSLEAKKKSLGNVVGKYEKAVQLTPMKENKLNELDRAVTVAEDAYLTIQEQYEESRLDEAKKLNEIRVIDKAKPPIYPKRPLQILYTLLGFLSGLLASCGLVFLFEFMDDTVKSIENAERILGYSVLATIPNFQHSRWKKFKS